MTRQTARQGGFTLIEVLVCLALMSLIATILIASLQLGGHSWQRVMKRAAASDDVALTQDFLRSRLSSLYPYTPIAGASTPTALESDGTFIEFSSASPAGESDGLSRYRIEISATTHGLIVRRNLRSGENPATYSATPEVLMANVASLRIQFYHKTASETGEWLDRWDETSVPRLIRIDINLSEKDTRQWPPLYIEPRVDTPVTCEFDVVGRICRTTT